MYLSASIDWKGKGKGKKRWLVEIQQWPAALRVCIMHGQPSLRVSAWDRCILGKRWWHQRKFLSSGLQSFATLSCILQEIVSKRSQLCVCVYLSVCSFFNNLVLKGKCYICTSDGLQCEYIKVTGEPQFSLAYIRFPLRDTITAHLWKLSVSLLWKETDCYRKRNTMIRLMLKYEY